jgi:hypothetical protein
MFRAGEYVRGNLHTNNIEVFLRQIYCKEEDLALVTGDHRERFAEVDPRGSRIMA